MRYTSIFTRAGSVLVAVAVAAGAVSCAGKEPASTEAPAMASSTDARPTAISAAPKNAQWTILCRTIRGLDHVIRAKAMKDSLLKTTQMRDWHLVHKEDESQLFYGYYASYEPKTRDGARAQKERAKIDAMVDARGNRPFSQAVFWQLAAPDPEAPPQWNLVNAPGDLSLQIAAYTGSPQRKQFAVEAVRAAREQGIEAYYFHGDTTSSVCIGSWPRTALEGTNDIDVAHLDEHTPALVLPSELSRQGDFNRDRIRNADGQQLEPVAPKMRATDPTLIAAMQRFPEHAVNGEIMVKSVTDQTGRVVQQTAESFIVPIPQQQRSILSDDTTLGDTPAEAVPGEMVPVRRTPGAGRLKSVGS